MKHILAIAFVAALIMAGFVVAMPGARAQRVGAQVDKLVWYEQPNQAQALLDLDSGAMDVYLFPLRTAADIASARSNPNLWTIDVGGSLNNLFLNQVPVNYNSTTPDGVGNPFTHREIREAMNWLVDRDFISKEIAGGSQFPHITLENRLNPEYGRDPVFMSELERKYAFNPALGSQMIAQALSGDADYSFNTATGKWLFKGNPIALDFVIRIEDIRRNIGERETLFETATDLSLQDGVRVWVTSGGTFAISKRVTGMVYDLAGGPWGLLATRTARFATVGGNLQVGQRLQYLSPWNPWQG